MILRNFFFIAALGLLCSCDPEQLPDYPFEYPGTRLVVNGELLPDSATFFVGITQDLNEVVDIGGEADEIENASLLLIDLETGQEYSIPHTASGYYSVAFYPALEPGRGFVLQVRAAGYPDAVSDTLMIPDMQAVVVPSEAATVIDANDFSVTLALSLELDDPANSGQFYNIYCTAFARSPMVYIYQDSDENYAQQCAIINYSQIVSSDQCFNGTSTLIPAVASYSTDTPLGDTLDLCVAAVDRLYFDYLGSLQEQDFVLSEIFGRKGETVSNMRGGYGMIVVRNPLRFRLPILQ